ncbi:hypothetical protein ACPUEK_12695 [Marinomonas gallaica]|uniref:hypothetical protein n=1 Tax=Marinomonas gallaica TaxID=1806667 RepID=UPI003CE5810E
MSTEQHLLNFGISMAEAKDFLLQNLDRPGFIFSTAESFGITNEMLGDIYGGASQSDVVDFFQTQGIDSTVLESNAEDTISNSTSDRSTGASQVNYWLLNQDSSDYVNAPLLNSGRAGVSFTLDDQAYNVIIEPSIAEAADTWEAFAAALQTVLDNTVAAGNTDLEGLNVTIDETNTDVTFTDAGERVIIPAITITDAQGRDLVPTGFVSLEDQPFAFNVYGHFNNAQPEAQTEPASFDATPDTADVRAAIDANRADTFELSSVDDTVTVTNSTVDAGFYLGEGDDLNALNITGFQVANVALSDGVAESTQAYMDQAIEELAAGEMGWFQYDGNTFIVVDQSGADVYQNGTDVAIMMTGLVDLSNTASFNATMDALDIA